jgi:two-component system response regulator AtoC
MSPEANTVQRRSEPANRGFIGGMSSAMRTLESVITEIAPTNIPILLVGESGTGKEMFARRIHYLSQHCEEPFLKIGCPSMNPGTFATELKLISNVDGDGPNCSPGTIFFDDISELEPACQRTLLYALPDDEPGPRRGMLTARVVSATTRNLDEETSTGRFRSELYYRINGVCLRLPPLQERKEDIPLLVEHFLTKHAAQLGRARPFLTPRVLRAILDHSWPGNIRELENIVKKIVVLGDEQLAIAELGVTKPEATRAEARIERGSSLKAAARAASREAERELIMQALSRTRWNRKRAAQELQISYKSLLHKLKQIELEDSKTTS